MRTEAEILREMRTASLGRQQELLQELNDVRAAEQARIAAEREVDLGNAIIRDHLTPVRTHELTTTATDWLDEVPAPTDDFRQAMRVEARLWFRKVHPAVKADREEFAEQAQGMAQRLAGQYGEGAGAARTAFLKEISKLYKQAEDDDVEIDDLEDEVEEAVEDETGEDVEVDLDAEEGDEDGENPFEKDARRKGYAGRPAIRRSAQYLHELEEFQRWQEISRSLDHELWDLGDIAEMVEEVGSFTVESQNPMFARHIPELVGILKDIGYGAAPNSDGTIGVWLPGGAYGKKRAAGARRRGYAGRPAMRRRAAADIVTDGTCGLSWDDSQSTSLTPAPAARCPFEYFHEYDEDGEPIELEPEDIPDSHPVQPIGKTAARRKGYAGRPAKRRRKTAGFIWDQDGSGDDAIYFTSFDSVIAEVYALNDGRWEFRVQNDETGQSKEGQAPTAAQAKSEAENWLAHLNQAKRRKRASADYVDWGVDNEGSSPIYFGQLYEYIIEVYELNNGQWLWAVESDVDESAMEGTAPTAEQAKDAAVSWILNKTAKRKRAAGDSPGQVNEEQSGNAESQVTDYDTEAGQDPMWSEDWGGEDDTGSQIGSEYHPGQPGAGEAVARRRTAGWSAGHNMPGYMPESEPYETDDWESARDTLIEDIDRAADHMFDSYPELVDQYDQAINELRSLPPNTEWGDVLPSSDSPHDLGISYWLNRTAKRQATPRRQRKTAASQWYNEGYDKGADLRAAGVSEEEAPDPLSGEWAGESIPEIFGSWEAATDEAMDDYEKGYWDGITGAPRYASRKQANQAPWDDFGSDSEFENWLGYQSRITESEQPGKPPFEYWVWSSDPSDPGYHDPVSHGFTHSQDEAKRKVEQFIQSKQARRRKQANKGECAECGAKASLTGAGLCRDCALGVAATRKQANQAPWTDFGSDSEFENWLGYQSIITETERLGEPPFEYWVWSSDPSDPGFDNPVLHGFTHSQDEAKRRVEQFIQSKQARRRRNRPKAKGRRAGRVAGNRRLDNRARSREAGGNRQPKGRPMPRKTAAEEFTCVSCSRKAVYYVFQEGYRASGFFVCADHVDNFREGRTVEKIAARKTSSKEIS